MNVVCAPNRAPAGLFWTGIVLAAIASIVVISLAADGERQAAGLAPVPFGWQRVIVVHAIANLFLSWYAARLLVRWRPALAARWKAAVWGGVGLVVSGIAVLTGDFFAGLFTSVGASYLAGLLLRIAWCTMVQVPWCMAGLAASSGETDTRRRAIPSRHLLGLAVVTAVGVPASYLAVFLEQETLRANQLWQQGQIVRAQRLVQQLCDVGSRRKLGSRASADGTAESAIDVTPRMALADLKGLADRAAAQTEALAGTTSDSGRLQLAQGYFALNRATEAVATLAPLAARSPRAALVLAQICRQEGQLGAARRAAERAIQLRGSPPAGEADREIALQAYDLLAILAGERGDYASAESYLLEAFARLPADRAAIHYRLGRHYEIAGDFPRALDHLRKAATSDPQRFAEPEGLVKKMLSTGAPVGLARPKSSRYQ